MPDHLRAEVRPGRNPPNGRRRVVHDLAAMVPAMMILTVDAHPEPVSGLDLRAVWHMGSVASRECIANTARMLLWLRGAQPVFT